MAGEAESPVWSPLIVSHSHLRLELLFNNEAIYLSIFNVVLNIIANQNDGRLCMQKVGPYKRRRNRGA